MESKILNALGIDPAFIFLFMLILFVVLFILYVNVTMKYNRLKNSYATFMKGKDGKSLEQSLKDKFEEAEAVLKFTKQNRTEIRELNRKLETNYQKVGIVKYDVGDKITISYNAGEPACTVLSVEGKEGSAEGVVETENTTETSNEVS